MAFECLKIAFLFIGAIVGAGFATGREVVLFFNRQSPFVVILSGIIAGLLCGIFLKTGKNGDGKKDINESLFPKTHIYTENALLLCTVIVYITMCAATENISVNLFGFKGGSVILSVLSLILSAFSYKTLKNLNLICVPVIIILIATVTLNKPVLYEFPQKYNFFLSFSYMSMNMLLGGYLIVPMGKKLTDRQIALTSLIVTVTVSVLLFMVYYSTLIFAGADMPMVDAASSKGMKYTAGIIILLSIFTTLISSGKIIFDATNKYIKNKMLCIIVIFVATIVPSAIGFKNLVNYCYPVVSYGGVIYTTVISLKYFKDLYRSNFNFYKRKKEDA